MKKSNFITGILYVGIGILFLLAALLTKSSLNSLFFGFSGAGIVPGIMMIYKYFYWSRPENKERYAERLEYERIELHDELKTKLRDKSGRCAYIFGMFFLCVSILLFSALGKLGIIEYSRNIILYLGSYLIIQIISGIVFFYYFLRKYQ